MSATLSNKYIVTVDKDFEVFRSRLDCLARSINRFSSTVLGETQIRSSFINPFITVLGYDMINPTEVEVEHVHRKTSVTSYSSFSRIDYIINLDNSPTLIIEAKKSSCTFSDCDLKQLCTYFNEIHPLIGVLTNGIVYKFYTSNGGDVSMRNCLDLTIENNVRGESFSRLDMNKMSKEPFFVFNFLDYSYESVRTLYLLTRKNISNSLLKITSSHRFRMDLNNFLLKQSTTVDKSLLEYLKNNCDSSDLSDSVIEAEIKNAFKVFEDFYTDKHSQEILLNHSSLSTTSYKEDYFDDDIILDEYDD